MADELTVEQALAELREMFPGKPVWIRIDADLDDDDQPQFQATVRFGFLRTDPKFQAETLAEAMQITRAWKEANNG